MFRRRKKNGTLIGRQTRLVFFAKGYVRGITNPVRQVQVVAKSIPGFYRVARGASKGDFEVTMTAPRTRFNGKASPHRVIESCAFLTSLM